MNEPYIAPLDHALDLVIDREIDVPVDLVWGAWTEPERLKRWFTPKPWTTTECEIDLRPGGLFRTVMRSPEGQDFSNVGCYLSVEPNRRLVWTGALGPGFRPAVAPAGGFAFTAVIALAPAGQGTRYTATVLHLDQAGRAQHEAMGFDVGWNVALDQLIADCKADEPLKTASPTR